jgi:hypothetical protein
MTISKAGMGLQHAAQLPEVPNILKKTNQPGKMKYKFADLNYMSKQIYT